MRKIPTLGVVSAGLLLAGSPAHAQDVDMASNVNIGIANGIQAHLPIQAPINFCGNAIGLLGSASASCVGGAKANYASGHHGHGGSGGSGGGDSNLSTAINGGIANGIQADAMVQVPINICGNAIGILGSATAACIRSGATANAFSDGHHRRPTPRPYGQTPRTIVPSSAMPAPSIAPARKPMPTKIRIAKKPEQGLLANLLSPVTGLLGGGGKARQGNGDGYGGDGKRCGNVSMNSFGNVGIANGIQAHVPVQIPVNFSGNAIAILGGPASASSTGGATANYC